VKVAIKDLRDVAITGVEACFTAAVTSIEKVDFFEWTAWPLATRFKTNEMVAGLLQGWHHTPVFSKVEYHQDAEIFYFSEGTALMYFIDLTADDRPVMDSVQMVRIPAGTLINVAARKGHWVPVAEGDRYSAIVVAPRQGDIHVALPEQVTGA
jgi:hypothetical protein